MRTRGCAPPGAPSGTPSCDSPRQTRQTRPRQYRGFRGRFAAPRRTPRASGARRRPWRRERQRRPSRRRRRWVQPPLLSRAPQPREGAARVVGFVEPVGTPACCGPLILGLHVRKIQCRNLQLAAQVLSLQCESPRLCTPAEARARDLHYRGTSLIRNCHSLGPYSRPIPRALRWS